MTKSIDERRAPLTEREMQTQPLPGEIDPKDARRVARHFAVVEKLRMEAAARAWAAKNGTAGADPSKK
jgi:hypothetical protein